jgi:hypothetical protein
VALGGKSSSGMNQGENAEMQNKAYKHLHELLK